MGTAVNSPGVDVLVVGSGAAGLTAALSAARSGASVTMIEASPFVGGTTAWSEGMVWAPLSRQAAELGLTDEPAQAVDYLMATGHGRADRSRVEAYVARIADTLATVEDATGFGFRLNRQSIDYVVDAPGATAGLRALNPGLFDGRRLGRDDFALLRPPLESMMLPGGISIASGDLAHYYRALSSPSSFLKIVGWIAQGAWQRMCGWPRGTRLANGNALAAALFHAVRRAGVEVMTNTRLEGLDRTASGALRAHLAGPGGVRTLVTGRGIVLAGGGISASAEMRAAHYPQGCAGDEYAALAAGAEAGGGRIALLAARLGAAFDTSHAEPALWTPVSKVTMPWGGDSWWPHFADRQKPGMLIVDGHGRRFLNEATVYHRFVPEMLRHRAEAGTDAVWLIADAAAVSRYGMGAVGPRPMPTAPWIGSGYLKTGRTVAELADAIGVPVDALAATVERFNAFADAGDDPDFGRGRSAYDRSYGDPAHGPNPCLRPLSGRLYAVSLVPGDIGSFAGLAVDTEARVLDMAGRAIPGLYAAGNAASSPFGGAYAGAGLTIGAALVTGMVAGRNAVLPVSFIQEDVVHDQGDVVSEAG